MLVLILLCASFILLCASFILLCARLILLCARLVLLCAGLLLLVSLDFEPCLLIISILLCSYVFVFVICSLCFND